MDLAYASALAQLSLMAGGTVLAWFATVAMPWRPRWALRLFVSGMFGRRVLSVLAGWWPELLAWDRNVAALVTSLLICGFCFETLRWLGLHHDGIATGGALDEASGTGATPGRVRGLLRVGGEGGAAGTPGDEEGAHPADRGDEAGASPAVGGSGDAAPGGDCRADGERPAVVGPEQHGARPLRRPTGRDARLTTKVAVAGGLVLALVTWAVSGRLHDSYVNVWKVGRHRYQAVTPKSAGLDYHLRLVKAAQNR